MDPSLFLSTLNAWREVNHPPPKTKRGRPKKKIYPGPCSFDFSQAPAPDNADGAKILVTWPRTAITGELHIYRGLTSYEVQWSCAASPRRSNNSLCPYLEVVLKKLDSYDISHFGTDDARRGWRQFLLSTRPIRSDPPPSVDPVSDAQIGLLLTPHNKDPVPYVRIEPVLFRVSANGNLKKTKPVRIALTEDGFSPDLPEVITHAVREHLTSVLIANQLTNQSAGTANSALLPTFTRPTRAAHSVIHLLSTTPVLWSPESKLLNAAHPLDANIAWRKREDGEQRLDVTLLPDHQDLKQNTPTMFRVADQAYLCDLAALSIHPLQTDPVPLNAALAMPPVPAALADEVHRELTARSQFLRLPLPDPSTLAQEIRVPPTATVRFTRILQRQASASIDYAYAGTHVSHEIAGYYETHHNGKPIRLYRDPAQENSIKDAIAHALAPFHSPSPVSHRFDLAGFADRAHLLSTVLERLEHLGVPYSFPEGFDYQLETDPVEVNGYLNKDAASSWLEFGQGIEIDGHTVELLPILLHLLETDQLTLQPEPDEPPDNALWIETSEGHFLSLQVERLRKLVNPILDLLRTGKLTREGHLKMKATDAGSLLEMEESGLAAFFTSKSAAEILDRLRDKATEQLEPKSFKGTLRAYQRQCLSWLSGLAELGLGGLLADDMGLGKTVQILAHLCDQKEKHPSCDPFLIVIPCNLLTQWPSQVAKFAPHFSVLKIQGTSRLGLHASIPEHDVVITTYETLIKDTDLFSAYKFSILCMDETEKFKNAHTLTSQALRKVHAARRIGMGGTPIENNLHELWSCISAVQPGALGSHKYFQKHFAKPVADDNDPLATDRLKKRIAPLMLRRMKAEVLKDLPEVDVELVPCDLSDEQRDVYETYRTIAHSEFVEFLHEKGIARGRAEALTKLLRLRQICDSPGLLPSDEFSTIQSAKEQWLDERLPRFHADARRVLIFSEWTSMLDRVAAKLDNLSIPYGIIDGRGKKDGPRRKAHEHFRANNIGFLLISTRSGGSGLDIPEACTHVILEPLWNPQKEAQCICRTNRNGQLHRLTVYKLMIPGTCEQRIIEHQQRKISLAASILDSDEKIIRDFNESDLLELFAPVPQGPQTLPSYSFAQFDQNEQLDFEYQFLQQYPASAEAA